MNSAAIILPFELTYQCGAEHACLPGLLNPSSTSCLKYGWIDGSALPFVEAGFAQWGRPHAQTTLIFALSHGVVTVKGGPDQDARGRISDVSKVLPLTHIHPEAISSQGPSNCARIDSMRYQFASVLVTQLGALEIYFRVCAEPQLLALAFKVELVIPGSPTRRRYVYR